MKFSESPLKGAFVIEPVVYNDHRGFFLETYSRKVFETMGLHVDFVQDNHSLSRHAGVLRGLHFQYPPYGQAKLIRVIDGAAYDVIVDLRKGSATYGEWFAVELSATNFKMLFAPKGFAHGFCTTKENTQVIYKVDAPYAPEAEGGICWDDPDLKIPWPAKSPIVSEKDKGLPVLRETGDVF